MVATGDEAPAFSAPLATGDVETFDLAERLDEAPLVLAFFPGAFTEVCSHEMNALDDRLGEIADADASLYGVSVDTPFALNRFRDELGLGFDLISDSNREIVDAWDLSMDFAAIGVENLAKRAVFVLDGDGVVTYAWVSDDPGREPDYDELLAAL